VPRGTDEVPQDGHIRTVNPNTTGIDRETKAFSLIQVHSCIIKLRKAKALCGQNPVDTRRIYGARRAMALPRAARQLVELLPIAFVPSRHALSNDYVLFDILDALWAHKVRLFLPAPFEPPVDGSLALSSGFEWLARNRKQPAIRITRAIDIRHISRGKRYSLPIVSNPL